MVPQRVVDALELIKVEAQYCEAFAALDALDFVVELLEQQNAIGQIRQGVVARHVRDALLGTLTLGHVFMRGEPAAAGDRFVDDRNSPPVRQVHDAIEGLPLGDSVSKPRNIFVGICGEAAGLDPMPEQLAKGAARFYDLGRKSVQFDINVCCKIVGVFPNRTSTRLATCC